MRRNGKQMGQRPRQITCLACSAVLNVQRDLRRRAVRGQKDVVEMGLQCWRCKRWTHIYFSSPELDQRRTVFRKAQRRAISTEQPKDVERMKETGEAYRAAYDQLNGEMRERMGIVDRLYVTDDEVDE